MTCREYVRKMTHVARLKIRIIDGSFIAIKRENPYWRAFYASGYGTDQNDKLVFHAVEVLYLVYSNKAIVLKNNEPLETNELLKHLKNIADIWKVYLIYRDIRERGYNVRVRDDPILPLEVFDRGKNPLQHESFALVSIAEAAKELELETLAQAVEKAKKQGKKLLIALLDENGDTTYYSVDETLVEDTILKIYRK